jgi:beta-glucosidase
MGGLGWWDVPIVDKGPLKKWWFIGNTGAIPRLKIPSLNMMDGGAGFRDAWYDIAGKSTCFPSLLSLAATWDVDSALAYGKALGEEFSAKGANFILGPSVNVHRSAFGGRNFEYLSGEDPYLGAQLTGPYVKGVQSRGVGTVLKHWVFNNQETHRDSENSIVDDKTAFELYFPPFEAAIEAGTTAVMCSYNKVNGSHSCASPKYLKILRETLGFRGFVQSDWYATHSTSVAEGLDQEMPFANHLAPDNLKQLDPSLVDRSVHRILAVMYRMNLFNSTKCSAPAKDWLMKDVTSKEHTKLARKIATESVVLLKNSNQILPISNKTIKTVAVVGSAASASANNPWFPPEHWMVSGDYYSGGGSGHVFAGNLVTPLAGITSRASAAGIQVIPEATDDVDKACAAAAKADLTIVVAGTSCMEGTDRKSLDLDNHANDLINALTKKGARVVVIAQVPGAVLMPWREDVQGIGLMFFGGQETGSAWASVLFGDHSPTGRLPLMIPTTEMDAIKPSATSDVVYAEGMATSYRNPNFKAAYPFGHGLSYSRFEYGNATSKPCNNSSILLQPSLCVSLSVRNIGKVLAETVAQLYLEMPSEAGHHAALLKGFKKTGLLHPGTLTMLTFRLTSRDLSYFCAATSAWKLASGSAVVHIGESSKDVRQSLDIEIPGLASRTKATIVV